MTDRVIGYLSACDRVAWRVTRRIFLVALPGSLPAEKSARAGGVAPLRTPPAAIPRKVGGVVTGFTSFSEVRKGAEETNDCLVQRVPHRLRDVRRELLRPLASARYMKYILQTLYMPSIPDMARGGRRPLRNLLT